jgi:hypothetical protein
MRAHPPDPPAKRRDRCKYFSSSLEQAEQLFQDAERVDFSVKPLLIFYGLSQACRAVIAASPRIAKREDYHTYGHGLEDTEILGSEMARMIIKPTGSESSMLGRLNSALDSKMWLRGTSMTLGQLWAAHPDLHKVPLPGTHEAPALQASINAVDGHDRLSFEVHDVPLRLLPSDEQQVIAELSQIYPGLAEAGSPFDGQVAEGRPRMIWPNGDTASLFLSLPEGNGEENARRSTLSRFHSLYWLLPTVGGVSGPQHEIVWWWAVLHSLSIRARYAPDRWLADLDPDKSSISTILETLLDAAQRSSPPMILEAITALQTIAATD